MKNIINPEKFLKNIDTKIYGKTLHIFDELDSTNKYAMNELEDKNDYNKVVEGACYLALKQTAGIGTSGNSWESHKPFGMWLSIILNSPIKKEPLSFVPAIAMVKMLKNYCNINAHLKWPNDVLVGQRKITGILVQAKSFSLKNISYVIGVGLNISQTENDFSITLKDIATSLKIETGKNYTLENIYREYMKYFEEVYTDKNIDLVHEWNKHTNMVDKIITIKKGENNIRAKVLSITKEGYLKIENLENKKTEVIEARAGIDINANYK